MSRYEANLKGEVEIGETFTDFSEVDEFRDILSNLRLRPNLMDIGRGGYYIVEIYTKLRTIKLHTYLKKLTFGGRENREYEKRAQFSAALDRRGFDIEQNKNEISLILALYKRENFDDTIICAWNINDWGYNEGRAFNCFVDIRAIAKAFGNGFVQYRTSIGQIACCFRPEWFLYYLDNKETLHKEIISQEILTNKEKPPVQKSETFDFSDRGLPRFEDLFQIIIDILRNNAGIISIENMEAEVADFLNLSSEARQLIHNPNEGYRTELGYRLAWARNYLKRAGFIENPKRSIWSLTQLGYDTLDININEIKKVSTEREIEADLNADILNDIEIEDGVEIEKNNEDVDIESPFDPNLVDIKTRTMSLDLILKRLQRGEIDLNTSFQRKSGLWDITKQSRLIESILVKFPLPAFYFDGSDDDSWLVVDGLQRLSSLDNYVNKRAFGLQKLEFLNQFNGKKFDGLPGNLRRRIEEFEITAYVISQGTPKVLKYNVFKRINTGGLSLTSQEIRNALNQGEPARFVKRLADMRSFKIATSFSIPEDRMLDREFVTRFLAFYKFPIEEYKSDMDAFLNLAMESINEMSSGEFDNIASRFNLAMQTANKIFDDDAFRKRYNKSDKRKPINKALFEVWSVLLSRLNNFEMELLIRKKNIIKNKFIELLNTDEEFGLAITSGTSDRIKVRRRFNEINKIIQSTLLS